MRIFACMASTLDGKIGPAGAQHFISISSKNDQDHLKALRDEADGVLMGANTFRTWPKPHVGHVLDRRLHHFLLSHSLDLDIHTTLFQDPSFPLTIFTDKKPVAQNLLLPGHVEVLFYPEGISPVRFLLEQVEQRGVQSLLVEGGGQILHQFIENRVLQELYLTIVPKLMGQPEAPDLLGGQSLPDIQNMQLVEQKELDGELYLHFKLKN